MGDAETDILSKLGILDSKAVPPEHKLHPVVRESRLRQTERGSVSGDSVNLLPESHCSPESEESPSVAQPSCHSIHSIVFYGFIYCYAVAFGIPYLASVKFTEDNLVTTTHLSFLAFGIPLGCYIAGFLFLRVQMMTSTVISVLMAVVISMLFNASQSFNNYCCIVLGATFGVFERNVYLFINEQWPRSSKRRLSIAYIVFFLGLLSVALTVKSEDFSRTRLVREAMSNADIHPTKPTSAVGISDDQESITNENAEKRRLAALKKLEKANSNCTNTTSPECPDVLSSFTTSAALPSSESSGYDYISSFLRRGRNRIGHKVDAIPQKMTSNITQKSSPRGDYLNIPFMDLGIFITLCIMSLFTDLSPVKHIFEPSIMDPFTDGTSTRTVKILSFLVSFLLELLCFGYLPLIAALHVHHISDYTLHVTTWGLIFGVPLIGRLILTMAIRDPRPQIIIWITLVGAVVCFTVLMTGSSNYDTLCNSAMMIILITMLPCELYELQQEKLSSSPFVISTRLFYAGTLGRLISPLLVSYFFKLNHTEDFLRFIQFGLIFLCVLFALLHRTTNLAVRQHRILTFTDAVSRGDVEAVKTSVSSTTKNNGTYSRLEDENSDNCLLSDFSDVDDW